MEPVKQIFTSCCSFYYNSRWRETSVMFVYIGSRRQKYVSERYISQQIGLDQSETRKNMYGIRIYIIWKQRSCVIQAAIGQLAVWEHISRQTATTTILKIVTEFWLLESCKTLTTVWYPKIRKDSVINWNLATDSWKRPDDRVIIGIRSHIHDVQWYGFLTKSGTYLNNQ